MDFLRKIYAYIAQRRVIRHLILVVCTFLVFIFICSVLLNLFTRHNTSEAVPDFSGMRVEEALGASRKAKLRIEVNDSLYVPAYEGGIILDQLPKPGTRVKKGRRVIVTINSHKQRMVDIPYVTGYSLRQAKNNLEVAGLEIDKLIFRDDIAANYILEERYANQVVESGSHLRAEQGSGITLVVGSNAEAALPVVPKLIGLPLSQAKSRLWETGLNLGKVEYDPEITMLTRNQARVYVQSLGQGVRTAPGTEVSLKLTLDPDKVEDAGKSSDTAARRRASAEEASAQEPQQ
ncbi:MAG: PASTA domain-containing protein [Rikenellaceae bacterium]|nr:PASTA domain-containing protein [Rikenellaceae bacterium]